MMRKYILYLLAILLAACSKSVPYSDETIKNDLRVPAYPLLMLHHICVYGRQQIS